MSESYGLFCKNRLDFDDLLYIELVILHASSSVIPGDGTCAMQPEHEAVEVSHQFLTTCNSIIISK